MAATDSKPYVSISVITPKPDRFEEFMELQLAQHHRVRGQVQGLRGGRLFRGVDGRSVVLVTAFDSAEDAQRFRQDPRFTEHIARVQPLLESAVPGAYETAYEVGEI